MVTATPGAAGPASGGQTMVTAAAAEPVSRPAAIPASPATPAAAAADLTGRKLDNYEVLGLLGKGGMGCVYRGRDTNLQRPAAIKCLAPQMAHDPELVERFLREARLVAKLRHDNIAGIFHLGVDEQTGAPWYAMELVEGRSLEALLKKSGPLELAEAARVVGQTALALEAALAKGIIHRDIKPANIMRTPEGQVKVTDFGLGRLLEGGQKLTQANMILGTAHFMSPEAAQGQEVDHRTDVYALGVTFFQLVTGQFPFDGPSAMSILQKHVTVAAPDVRTVRRDLPSGAAAVIERMLAKAPEDRYGSYPQLRADLEALASGRSPEAAGATRGGPAVGPAAVPAGDVLQTARQGAVVAAQALAPRVSLTRRWKVKVPLALGILLVARFAFWGHPGMVLVPGGTYQVGKPDGLVQVELAPFYIDAYEVTNGRYNAALGMPPAPADLADLPKRLTSLQEAEAYLEATGRTLPDEAQWQVAARGKQAGLYPWGDLDDRERLKGQVATFGGDLRGPAPVGSHALDVSSFGCFDMAGNLMEVVRVAPRPEPAAEEPSRRALRLRSREGTPPTHTTLGAAFDEYLDDESCAWKDPAYLRPPNFSGDEVGFRGVLEVGLVTRLVDGAKVGATWLVVLLLALFL